MWSSPKNIPAYDTDYWSSKDYDGYRKRNMTVHLDKKIDNNHDMLKAWTHMARADILIMSQSSFSMVPAMLGMICLKQQLPSFPEKPPQVQSFSTDCSTVVYGVFTDCNYTHVKITVHNDQKRYTNTTQVHEHELRDFPVEPGFSTGELDGWQG